MTKQTIEYYNQKEFWGADKSPDEIERITTIISMIPEQVVSILDAGCGDGAVSNGLIDSYESVYCMDISEEALKHAKGNKVLGSLESIPFEESRFDLVISSEVLEHLPDAVYHKTVSEVSRVAGKYIMISVPNDEPLEDTYALCNSCGNQFNVWHHVRRFNVKNVSGIFPEFRLLKTTFCGPDHPISNSYLTQLVRKVGGGYPYTPTTICSQCGSRDIRKSRRTPLTMAINALNVLISYKKRKRWMVALYERK
jgi:SAM-dependent methyltransferase